MFIVTAIKLLYDIDCYIYFLIEFFFQDKLIQLAQYPDSILLPQINLLASSKHKKEVQKRSFSVLIVIYKQLHKAIHDPKNKYENPQLILMKQPEDLEKVLCFSCKM